MRPNLRKLIRGTRWLICAPLKETNLKHFRKVYYIQSTDEQIKKCALTQISKNKTLILLSIQEKKKGDASIRETSICRHT